MVIQAAIFLSWSMLVCSISPLTAACDNGWFGSNCQYKCRCNSNICDRDGACINDPSCATGWFGPACQFSDLSMSSQPISVVNGGNAVTCTPSSNTVHGVTTVTVALKYPTQFTWLRIRVSQPDFLHRVTIYFNDDTNIRCPNPRNATVDNNTLDIHCNSGIICAQSVTLTGDGVQYLCSVYVSGGRNVALNQTTAQSSTYRGNDFYFTSNLAVDGDTSGNFDADKSCSCTDNVNPNWNVTFSPPQSVQRYLIYNREDPSKARLQQFILQNFDASNTSRFIYIENNTQVQDVYSVTPDLISPIVLVKIMLNTSNWLQLCEVEVYGDSNCQMGRYGRECDHTCRCAGNESCFISTGGCPSGCVVGFYGEACDLPCVPETYGAGCGNYCSMFCAKNASNGTSCDNVNGTCLGGCVNGYRGPKCLDICAHEKYGFHCNNMCSDFCVKTTSDTTSCHHVNGTCLYGCKDGYKGATCTTACDPETYGAGCSYNCSMFCANNTSDDRSCDNVNGTCRSGCVIGYDGPNCTETCASETYGLNCKNKCSNFCVKKTSDHSSCHHVNGTCFHGCQTGYEGATCTIPCTNGTYGQDCNSTCSDLCVQKNNESPCDHIIGTCLFGCDGDYDLSICKQQAPPGSSTDNGYIIGAAVGSVLGAIFLILVIVAVIVLGRRHKKGKPETERYPSTENTMSENSVPLSETSKITHFTENNAKPNTPGKTANGKYYNAPLHAISTVVSLEDLDAFMTSKDPEFFKNQFSAIPANEAATMKVGLSSENKHKNRYKNICAYDHSRVHLRPKSAKKEEDYINASYIGGYNSDETFIAAQGPTKFIMEDFLRMLWEQQVDKVVMLTSLVEDGKQKCEKYWPDEDEMRVGEITVTLTTTQVFADYTIRRLQLKMEGQSVLNLIHFHFTSWPDKDVPNTPWGLVDFEQRVASYPTRKPIVVHCSAGVGRTGTFIALRNVMRQAEETGQMDFFTTVQKLRHDRINMVQTIGQYIFLHRAAQVAMLCIGTTVTSSDIQGRIVILDAETESGQTKMEKEYKQICSTCDKNEEDKKSDENLDNVYENSQSAVNKEKNRDDSILPKEMYRAKLLCDSPNYGNYINAVLLPSFSKQNQIILTQLPLPTTITDFWRLVIEYKVKLIVAFQVDLKGIDQTIADYLPPSDNIDSSIFNIKTELVADSTYWRQQKLGITPVKKRSSVISDQHTVTHLTITTNNKDTGTLLAITQHIRTDDLSGDGRIIYMCRNGADYSGLAYVLSLLLDRIDNDRCLTVPLVVGASKAVRPQIIPTLDQYKLLYEVLDLYSETMNEYSNFGFSNS